MNPVHRQKNEDYRKHLKWRVENAPSVARDLKNMDNVCLHVHLDCKNEWK